MSSFRSEWEISKTTNLVRPAYSLVLGPSTTSQWVTAEEMLLKMQASSERDDLYENQIVCEQKDDSCDTWVSECRFSIHPTCTIYNITGSKSLGWLTLCCSRKVNLHFLWFQNCVKYSAGLLSDYCSYVSQGDWVLVKRHYLNIVSDFVTADL